MADGVYQVIALVVSVGRHDERPFAVRYVVVERIEAWGAPRPPDPGPASYLRWSI